MFVYVGRTYRSAVSSRVWKTEICEKCGCQYAYLMVRRATGSGHSPYLLNNQGAATSAAHRAQQVLQHQLATCDPVECPDCGWFSRAMVQAAAANSWKWSVWGSGPGIDPNRGYPQNRGHFPGMPTPIRLSAGTRPRAQRQTLMPPVEEPGGHITINPQRDRLPDTCCSCLEPTQERGSIEFWGIFTRAPKLDCALCGRCVRKYRLMKACITWGVMIAVVSVITPVFLVLAWRSLHGELDMTVIAGGGGGLCVGLGFGAFLLLALQPLIPQPMSLSAYDGMRNLYRLRFRNRGFVAEVQRSVAQTPLAGAEQVKASLECG